jgi:hypothetical protein
MIEMWANLGYELPIKEGVYWLDNNFIKAFTPDGTLHKLWKYKVFDDLHIEITKHKDNKMMLSIIKIQFSCGFSTSQTTIYSHL